MPQGTKLLKLMSLNIPFSSIGHFANRIVTVNKNKKLAISK
jgi:hypothetical protein